MPTLKKPVKTSQKSTDVGGLILDGVGYVIGQIALPIPDFIFYRKKKSASVKGKKTGAKK